METINSTSNSISLNRLRRGRGYNFEYTLIKRFNALRDWQARRLGGSSTGFPDVVATNNKENILYAIECKSSASDIAPVPYDQIERCMKVLHMFGVYQTKHMVLAFKFMNKKRAVKIGEKTYVARPLKEYYKIIVDGAVINWIIRNKIEISCLYNGSLVGKRRENGNLFHHNLDSQVADVTMPWHIVLDPLEI